MVVVRSKHYVRAAAVGATLSALVLTGCTQAAGGGSAAPAGASGDPDACSGFPAGDIEFVVPYSAGGGFDTWARLIAPAMQELLPEQVNIPVVNREGAGGITGVTEVLGSPPDGHTIVITEPGILATTQVTGQVDVDFSTMEAIGRVTVGPEVIVVNADSEWETIEDVQAAAADRELLMGTGGLAAINIVAFDALDLAYTNVVHEGSSEALLSVIRGDTEIAVFPLNSVAEGIRSGDLKPLLLVGTVPGDENPDADVVEGVATLDEVTGQDGLGAALEQHRVVLAAPETPECAVSILGDAMEKTFGDADFIATAEEAGLVPAQLGPEETQEIVRNTIETIGGYQELLAEALEG
jgi:tripartite-type tricarboxylate transporter receptor subunit TctC